MPSSSPYDAADEIRDLEAKLSALKSGRQENSKNVEAKHGRQDSNLHSLLLLADSALPLGSFAFSAGLESFIAHSARQAAPQNACRFTHFLSLSLDSLASMTLPYVHDAWSDPSRLATLDNDIDASTTCTVNKRASVAQGRALLTIWQRSLKARTSDANARQLQAFNALQAASDTLIGDQASSGGGLISNGWSEALQAHFAPLFGVLAALMNVPLEEALYLYLMNHAKMVLSAAIRASILGPYQSQSLLDSKALRDQISALSSRQVSRRTGPSDAAQSVPAMDLWSGRHELVYSRIFNS